MKNNTPDIKIERIHTLKGNGVTRAFCDIVVAGSFVIRGFRVINGANGLFAGMPRELGRDEKWYETFSPISKEIRVELQKTILDAYREVVNENE